MVPTDEELVAVVVKVDVEVTVAAAVTVVVRWSFCSIAAREPKARTRTTDTPRAMFFKFT